MGTICVYHLSQHLAQKNIINICRMLFSNETIREIPVTVKTNSKLASSIIFTIVLAILDSAIRHKI